jgi:hypothetical protein
MIKTFFNRIKQFVLNFFDKKKQDVQDKKIEENINDDFFDKKKQDNQEIMEEKDIVIEITEDNNKKQITQQDIIDNILHIFNIDNIKKDIFNIKKQKQTQENIGKLDLLHYKLLTLQEEQEITNFLNDIENNINNLINDLLEETK